MTDPEQLNRFREGFRAGFDGETVAGDFGISSQPRELGEAPAEKDPGIAQGHGAAQEVFGADVIAAVERRVCEPPFREFPDSAEAVFQEERVVADGVIFDPTAGIVDGSRFSRGGRERGPSAGLSGQGFRGTLSGGDGDAPVFLLKFGRFAQFGEAEGAEFVEIALFFRIVARKVVAEEVVEMVAGEAGSGIERERHKFCRFVYSHCANLGEGTFRPGSEEACRITEHGIGIVGKGTAFFLDFLKKRLLTGIHDDASIWFAFI